MTEISLSKLSVSEKQGTGTVDIRQDSITTSGKGHHDEECFLRDQVIHIKVAGYYCTEHD